MVIFYSSYKLIQVVKLPNEQYRAQYFCSNTKRTLLYHPKKVLSVGIPDIFHFYPALYPLHFLGGLRVRKLISTLLGKEKIVKARLHRDDFRVEGTSRDRIG